MEHYFLFVVPFRLHGHQNLVRASAQGRKNAQHQVAPMQRVLVVAMGWMKKAHLTAHAVPRKPTIQVGRDAQLLRDVLNEKFGADDPAQQLASLDEVVKPPGHEPSACHRYEEEKCSKSISIRQDLVVLAIVPLAEIFPTPLEITLRLAVYILQM